MPERMMIDKDGNVTLVPMSTREQMALECLKAIIRNPAGAGYPQDQVERAVKYADALLQALEGKL